MNRILSVVAVLGVMIPGTSVAQTTRPSAQAGTSATWNTERKISIHLRSGKVRFAFQILADGMGVSLDLDPGIDQQPVALKLDNVTTRTMLDALCDSIGCQWRVNDKTLVVRLPSSPFPDGIPADSKDPPGTITRPAIDGKTPNAPPGGDGNRSGGERGSIRVHDAALPDVLFAISGLASGNFVMDGALAGKRVDVDAKNVTWQEALDLVCVQAGCRWETIVDTPPVIRVRPR